jgi:hypothetical protein
MKRPRDEENLEKLQNTENRNIEKKKFSIKRPREENNNDETYCKKKINKENIYKRLMQEEEEKLNKYFSVVCL